MTPRETWAFAPMKRIIIALALALAVSAPATAAPADSGEDWLKMMRGGSDLADGVVMGFREAMLMICGEDNYLNRDAAVDGFQAYLANLD